MEEPNGIGLLTTNIQGGISCKSHMQQIIPHSNNLKIIYIQECR